MQQRSQKIVNRSLLGLWLIGAGFPLYADDLKESETKTISSTNVVITASGFAQDIKEAPASISIIEGASLTDKRFDNIGDALNDLEGVSIDQGGKAGGVNIGIRGLSNDYTLLMVDGKRVSQNSSGARPNGFGDVDSSFIPPASAIARIEVVRGPMSTLYGSDALGGVVNIITKKIPEKWGGEITIHHTTALNNDFNDRGGMSFYTAGPLVKDLLALSLMGSFNQAENAKGRYAENINQIYPYQYTGNAANFTGLGKKKLFNGGAKLVFTPNSDHDITLSYDQGTQRYDNSKEQLGTLNTSVNPKSAGGGYSDHLNFLRSRAALSHEGRIGTATTQSSVLWDRTKTKGRLNPIHYPAKYGDNFSRDIAYSNVILDHKWMFSLGDHYLSIGGQYKHQKLTDTLVDAPINVKQWQWALFLEDEWRINSKFTATMGLRYDKNEDFGNHFSPRLYLSWNINDHWQLKGGIGRAFRAPDVNLMTDDIIGFGGQGTIPLLGNKDLKPETSTSTELSLLFDNNRNFSATLTGFYTKFNDKIESLNVPNCRASKSPSPDCLDLGNWERRGKPVSDFSKRFNVDDATIYGVEMGARFRPIDALGLSANYTYTQSSYKNSDGRKLPLNSTARHMVNAKVDWDINERWNVWAQGEYRAKQFNDLNWNGEKIYYNAYGLMNIGVKFAARKDLSFSAGIDNLLDKDFIKYGRPLTGKTAPDYDADFTKRYNNLKEGRRLWLSMKYTF